MASMGRWWKAEPRSSSPSSTTGAGRWWAGVGACRAHRAAGGGTAPGAGVGRCPETRASLTTGAHSSPRPSIARWPRSASGSSTLAPVMRPAGQDRALLPDRAQPVPGRARGARRGQGSERAQRALQCLAGGRLSPHLPPGDQAGPAGAAPGPALSRPSPAELREAFLWSENRRVSKAASVTVAVRAATSASAIAISTTRRSLNEHRPPLRPPSDLCDLATTTPRLRRSPLTMSVIDAIKTNGAYHLAAPKPVKQRDSRSAHCSRGSSRGPPLSAHVQPLAQGMAAYIVR
jgi:hypothetical protein